MKPEKKVRREPDVGKIIDRTIVRLWDTIEELEALNPAELHFYRVAVFGSARLKAEDPEYRDVRELASRLTEIGCDIVTGGGPGLMEAANEGAARSRGQQEDAVLRPDDRDPLREGEPVSRQRDGAPDLLLAPPPLRAHVPGLRALPGRHRDRPSSS